MVDKPLQTLLPSDQQLLAQNQGGEPVDPQQSFSIDDPEGGNPDQQYSMETGDPIEGEEAPLPPQQFDEDLSDHLHEDDLTALGFDLVQKVEEDKRGRQDWIEVYKDGLKYLGIKEDKKATPWMGACATTHPMMLEAIVRYQSRALVKLFPADGPAKLDIEANLDQPNAQQMQIELNRSQKKFNRHVREKMPEFRDEQDRMLFNQAAIGYAVKKVFYHEKLGRIASQFVPAEHFIVPYGFPNLETCPRFSEEIRRTLDEVASLQRRGFYRDVTIQSQIETLTDVDQKKAELIGQEPSVTVDDSVTLYEVHVDLFIEPDQYGSKDQDLSPYIVTIDKGSNQILCIKRGWRQADPKRRKRSVFIGYPFVPADGSYGYGFIHLIGQIASSATKIMRQLVDAGTLSNLPGGLKSKTARMLNSQNPIAPAEWRDVDIDPENLDRAFKVLPYKEPSQTLLALMQGMIDEGKSFSSTADLDISASSQNAPVGTTLALLERQTEVSNAIQSRLHDSFRRELALIVELLAEYEPDVYSAIFGPLENLTGGPASVYPVGDPTSATLSQRIIQLQSVLQISAQSPQAFNMPALFRAALTAMGVDDVQTLVPDNTQQQPVDPIQETMAILTGKPVKAFESQDHDAHLQVHSAVAQDPYYQQKLAQNPQAPAIMAANEAHIAEHLGFQFRSQVQQQLGVQLPPLGQMPPQIETAISSLIGPAVQAVMQQHQAQAAQQAAQQQQQDPAFQLEQASLQQKAQAEQNKMQIAAQKLQFEKDRGDKKDAIELLRIQSQAHQADAANQTQLDINDKGNQLESVGKVIDAGKAVLDHVATNYQAELNHSVGSQQADAQNMQAALDHHNAGQDRQADLVKAALSQQADMYATDKQHEAAMNPPAQEPTQ